ncbi:putative Holliday junction resolvase [Natronocella acetinitrilica]|jgi:putative holliday junction resolvase|uniref:Putative pre-16S rRNA nuclease n=1 Tax=Natronocella acetinitrilica TaxID=414046 RepID=A0AAE3G3I5_9GAMM|nr:Holliday junction resolvase RuvX [Natronocella acetinitrilica]MCP1675136.1 putative Holliday junction resolvase [Natronocella acetinitrilica]
MSPATCLGFDYGTQRIGIAIGDTLTGTARPLRTLQCRNPGQVDWPSIAALIDEWRPDALVVGLPCNDDGSPGALAPRTQRFARQLHGRFGLPVHEVNEHLSSVEAEQRLAELGQRRTRDDPGAIDMMAAAVILETWLAADAS